MWLGGQTESFQNVGGGKGVYNVLTLQKSMGGGAKAHLGGALVTDSFTKFAHS